MAFSVLLINKFVGLKWEQAKRILWGWVAQCHRLILKCLNTVESLLFKSLIDYSMKILIWMLASVQSFGCSNMFLHAAASSSFASNHSFPCELLPSAKESIRSVIIRSNSFHVQVASTESASLVTQLKNYFNNKSNTFSKAIAMAILILHFK